MVKVIKGAIKDIYGLDHFSLGFAAFCTNTLQIRHNERDNVSNHQRIDCLPNVCSGADQRKHQHSLSLASVRGIYQWPADFLHKGPVTRKMFPFDDVIMIWHFLDLWLFTFFQYFWHTPSSLRPAFQGNKTNVVVLFELWYHSYPKHKFQTRFKTRNRPKVCCQSLFQNIFWCTINTFIP